MMGRCLPALPTAAAETRLGDGMARQLSLEPSLLLLAEPDASGWGHSPPVTGLLQADRPGLAMRRVVAAWRCFEWGFPSTAGVLSQAALAIIALPSNGLSVRRFAGLAAAFALIAEAAMLWLVWLRRLARRWAYEYMLAWLRSSCDRCLEIPCLGWTHGAPSVATIARARLLVYCEDIGFLALVLAPERIESLCVYTFASPAIHGICYHTNPAKAHCFAHLPFANGAGIARIWARRIRDLPLSQVPAL